MLDNRKTVQPWLAGMAAVLALTACTAAPRGLTEASWREYLEATARLGSRPAPLMSGSADERRAIERFQALLSDYKAPGFAAGIREVYADELFFNDTLKTLYSVEEVEEHFSATAAALEEGRVEFVDLVSREGDYYFRWLMRVRARRLAGGDEILSAGMSHVRFDEQGKVVLHQDFWDSSGGLFEHAPALGWLLRRARARL